MSKDYPLTPIFRRGLFTCILVIFTVTIYSQEKVFPGADEQTPSKSQYFSWINNTNEGATEEHTRINLDFFKWLHDEYGMILDIYAFDAGLIDGKDFYGSMRSDRFVRKFPNGLDAVVRQAKQMQTRLGLWGGPDGFGNTAEETTARKEEMISLCRDYGWALFKFDAVCGQLRPEKEADFIDMMKRCRQYSPGLILLNHRLALNEGKPHATTFLWEGAETYIDVHMQNHTTAPHNRAGALNRGLVPGLQRLTEDCGVCISSCIDYWEDDLILQAFNRSLILAPEIYGNPWLMRDDEYSRLARIFNLHRKYATILTEGIILPDSYGEYPVSRGNSRTRLVTLRNLSWESKDYILNLTKEIGLEADGKIEVRQFHPTEKIIGYFNYGSKVVVNVAPFRSVLVLVTADSCDEPGVTGTDYEVVKNIPGQPIEIKLLGMPGTKTSIQLPLGFKVDKALLDGKEIPQFARGKSVSVKYNGNSYKNKYHRKLIELISVSSPLDADRLYESTVFAADNNALEVRSLKRSGETNIPAVKAARDAFFNQPAFVGRGAWDKYLFDGNMETSFYPSRRFGIDQRVKEGCFRLNLGEIIHVDSILIRVKDDYSLQPLLTEEGNFAEISADLKDWKTVVYMSGHNMNIPVNSDMKYLKLPFYPERISEIEVYANGRKVNPALFTASNLFADNRKMKCEQAWSGRILLDEVPEGSYLSVAVNGEHGVEGAYAALKVGDKYIGAPSRAISYPSNTWEYVTAESSSNYTYYFPLNENMKDKEIEVYVLGYEKDKSNLKPEVWISAYPVPYEEKKLVLIKE